MIRISKKTEYALRALIDVALLAPIHPLITIPKIAQSTQIPAKFLEQILLTLKNAGLLKSKRGVDGGYSLQRPLDEIFLEEIFRIFEGPLCEWPCVEKNDPSACPCPDPLLCPIRISFTPIHAQMRLTLQKTSLAQLTDKIQALKSQSQETPQYII